MTRSKTLLFSHVPSRGQKSLAYKSIILVLLPSLSQHLSLCLVLLPHYPTLCTHDEKRPHQSLPETLFTVNLSLNFLHSFGSPRDPLLKEPPLVNPCFRNSVLKRIVKLLTVPLVNLTSPCLLPLSLSSTSIFQSTPSLTSKKIRYRF